jgi:hypothetical protein
MRKSCVVAVLSAALVSAACGQSVLPVGPSSAGAADSSSGSSAAQSVPFKGDLEGTQTVTPLQPPLALVSGEATGTATHLGRFTVQFPHIVNFALAQGEGTFTFTAANGDTLTADFVGKAQIGAVTSIVEEAVVTGGTGRFAGASGTFTVRRTFNQSTGVTTGTFEGTLSGVGAGQS